MLDEAQVREKQRRALGVDQPYFGAIRPAYGVLRYSRTGGSVIEPQTWKEGAIGRVSVTSDQPLSIEAEIISPPRWETRPKASWLFDALVEIEDLPKSAKACGFVAPDASTLATVSTVVRLCDTEGLSEPILDVREAGAVEIFCREGVKGLLVVVNSNHLLQVFGDFSGDTWRARYDLSGVIWRVHLKAYFRDLVQQVISPPISVFMKT